MQCTGGQHDLLGGKANWAAFQSFTNMTYSKRKKYVKWLF